MENLEIEDRERSKEEKFSFILTIIAGLFMIVGIFRAWCDQIYRSYSMLEGDFFPSYKIFEIPKIIILALGITIIVLGLYGLFLRKKTGELILTMATICVIYLVIIYKLALSEYSLRSGFYFLIIGSIVSVISGIMLVFNKKK